jgi:predicted ABC-type ATPase
MVRPRTIVVAGPSGSGKTRYFPVAAFGVDAFNIDDRRAQIVGSYRGIPRDVCRAVANECERFVVDHIARRQSFAVETTLRTAAAIEQGAARPEAGLRG